MQRKKNRECPARPDQYYDQLKVLLDIPLVHPTQSHQLDSGYLHCTMTPMVLVPVTDLDVASQVYTPPSDD